MSNENISQSQSTGVIPLARLIALRKKSLSYTEIAKIVGCDKSNVLRRLQDLGDFEIFADNIDTSYELLQHRLYNSITDACIAKAPLQSRIWAIAVLEDKKRLVRNQSTAIIDVDHTISSISDLSRREKILEAKYKVLCNKELE